MTNGPWSTGSERPRPDSSTCVEAHCVSDLNVECECVEQEQEKEETSTATKDQPPLRYTVPTSSGRGTDIDEDDEKMIMITTGWDTRTNFGLGRLPGRLNAAVHHSDLAWKTDNISVSINNDVIEWGRPILMHRLSAMPIMAPPVTYEFQLVLGNGQQMRELSITVEKELDHGAKDLLFIFPVDENAISPCSPPLLVTIRQREHNGGDPLASRILDRYHATTESRFQLEDATNQGHSSLGCVIPRDHRCCAVTQSNLATANFICCQIDDTDTFLHVPLTLYCNTLTSRPISHLYRPSVLIQLAAMRQARLGRQRDEVDAVPARALLHEVLKLSSTESDEHRVATSMFQLHGCIMNSVRAGGQSSTEHDSGSVLTDLAPWTSGTLSLHCFQRLSDLADLQQATLNLEASVQDGSVWNHWYIAALFNLGLAFLYRFARLGDLSDLEQAILRSRQAVDLIPDGHPDKPACLNNLGISFKIRFERLGELSDLAQAISRLENAIDLTPHGNPRKPGPLNNIGNAFRARFERFGKLIDLEQAISRQREAVDLAPHSHPHRPAFLNNLGASLLIRFECLGELSDLEQGISRFGDAVHLTPDDHPDRRVRLNNLGNSLKTRFKHLGELSDLEQAIMMQKDVVDLTPRGHLHKPTCLNNLATSLFTRFECLGQLSDLEQAISKFRDAVDLMPHGHPDKPAYLDNLGNCLQSRFECLGMLSDLEQAISSQRDAIDLTPDDHCQRPSYLGDLGNSFLARFQQLGEVSDFEQAVAQYARAACASVGPTIVRFHASQAWISCARTLRHHSLLRAYSVAVSLLPQLAWIGLSLAHRYRELIRGTDVVREAAAAAIDMGHLETAVEWLEQGRSIVWGELFQLRSSHDELSCAYPDHAHKLRELSAALEHASTAREKLLSPLSEQSQRDERCATESLQQEADRHRTLAIKRDKLLEDIRGFPGFERFLLHKEYSQLRTSAHSGPVVILNAAETRCDALMVLADVEDVIHVPLPAFSLRLCKGLQNTVKDLLIPARDIRCDERTGHSVPRRQVSWEFILSVLWNGIVKPVLDALGLSNPGDLSRIFWCPTGPFAFLPIHAAGLYGTQSSEPGNKVSDFVVSSYIPTLSVLAFPSEAYTSSTCSSNLRFLAVRQPSTDGHVRLPGVDVELEHIRTVIRNSPFVQATITESSVGTVEEVLALMKNADWVHFACHGVQDAVNPTESGLCLADQRRMKLSNIISLTKRPRGGLAFLSACQTAKGDEDLSDEAIHIAAGMLFAGYGGVVGTMWSLSDTIAPLVARDVYGQLFRRGTTGTGTPDYREAARALQDAVGRLRDGGASFVEWLPFIHVGL